MAKHTRGTLLRMQTATSGVYANVAEVLSIEGPGGPRDRVDVTHLGTTSDFRVYLGNFIDPGAVAFEVNYLPLDATHKGSSNGLAAKYASGTTEAWQVLPAGATSMAISFNAYVSNFRPRFAVGEQMRANAELQVTQAITFPS